MKMNCYQLVFEITRRCNMACKHCMRGEAQCKDISKEVINRTLDNISEIGTITLTGGEIAINVEAIRYILDECRKRYIPVRNFYFVTNGKVVTDEFLMAIMDWNCYTLECGDESEFNGLALSHDIFHEDIPLKNVNKLKSFSFFTEDKKVDWSKATLINLGRARNLHNYERRDPRYTSLDVEYDEYNGVLDNCGLMTITVDGDILTDCDYEYESTDIIKVGNVLDENWVEALLPEYEYA